MEELKKVWSGGYGLPAAFWLFYVLGCFAILFLGLILVLIASWARVPNLGVIVVNVLLVTYLVFVMVGVWRSASHYPGAFGWGIKARIVISLHAANIISHFINDGTLVVIDGAHMTIELAF
jgi:hypothetical protein